MNTDLELINATLSGDKSAFGILAARHQTQVYRLAYRIISNPSDASDIVQETLLRAYQNLERLRDKSKFSFWLLQIAKNQCINWIREHQKALMTVEDELASNRLRLPPAPDEILVERELYERVMAEISKLPEHSQKAVEMFYIEGKSYTEIQRELGVTKGTLGRLLHNAKAQLRGRLRDAYLGAALWTGDSLKRLTPGHTRAITGSSAISGLKYLMVSAALHSLIFTGMSATGVHWSAPNGINDTSGYSSAIDISLVKINSPDRISLPSYVFVELPSPVRADLKLPRPVEFMPAERIILKLLPPGPERLNSRIVRAEIPPRVPAQYLEAALIEPMIHNTSPLLDRATPGLNFAFPGATDALGRTSPIPDGRPLFRSRNELAFPDEAAKPVTGPLYDDKIQPRIVFISNRENKHRSHIYIMNIDGTGVKRLDNDDLHQWSAAVSPKERQIVFHTSSNSRVSGPGIYSMEMDSGHLEFLTLGVSPVWSPDGEKIAFCRPEAGSSEIYTIDGSGSETPLTRNRASNFRPAWSPDSARIAFSSNMKLDRRIRNIYVMNADGTDMRQLTYTSTVGRWNDYPAWSPDGTKIAYAAGKTGRGYRIQSTIFIMDVDGSNRRALVAQAYCPTWSPDGRKIVFCSNLDGNEEIYVIDTDGKNLQRLTDNHYQDNQPSWISAGLLD